MIDEMDRSMRCALLALLSVITLAIAFQFVYLVGPPEQLQVAFMKCPFNDSELLL